MNLSAREIELEDIEHIANYWLSASPEYLKGMGADYTKMPGKDMWQKMLRKQIETPYEKKLAYAIIWLVDGQAVGHNNVDHIIFGNHAKMHLHLWQSEQRQKGLGSQLLKQSIPYFFEKLQLDYLLCETYALNPAPNYTLPKVGFEFIKTYTTIPGSINFEQEVKQWKLTKDKFKTQTQ